MKWIPIADAAKKMGMSLDELLERVIEEQGGLDLPCAIKCRNWTVKHSEGHRAKLLAKKDGDPHLRVDLRSKPFIEISGYFRLWESDLHSLAIAWPEPLTRFSLRLWTDAHKWASPDDMLVPAEYDAVCADEVLIDAEEMGWLSDKINTQSKEHMLEIIGTLAMAAGLDLARIDPAAVKLAVWMKRAGVNVGLTTLTSRLKEAKGFVREVSTDVLLSEPNAGELASVRKPKTRKQSHKADSQT